MGDNIAAANPDKEMLRLCSVRCPHMNQITLEDTLESLKKEQYEIVIDEGLAAGDQVIVSGLQRAIPGQPAKAAPLQDAPAAPGAAPAPAQG